MNKAWREWMPIAAGALDILSGSLSVLPLLVLWWSPYFWPLLWPAILAIVGGLYAWGRNEWSVALAGSISAFLLGLSGQQLFFEGFAIIHVLVGIAAVTLTLLSRQEFQSERLSTLQVNRGKLSVIAGVSVIVSGILQVGISSYLIWPVIFGDTIITEHWTPDPSISPQEVFYTLPWFITGIIAVILGSISIVRPERRNLALLGAITALIPLGIIVTYCTVFRNPLWALIFLIGIAAIVLTILSRGQFEKE